MTTWQTAYLLPKTDYNVTYCLNMMKPWHGNAFRISGPLWWESIDSTHKEPLMQIYVSFVIGMNEPIIE